MIHHTNSFSTTISHTPK